MFARHAGPGSWLLSAVYFYSNKAFGSGGNTYREPAAYPVQYYNGSSWVDVPGRLAVRKLRRRTTTRSAIWLHVRGPGKGT